MGFFSKIKSAVGSVSRVLGTVKSVVTTVSKVAAYVATAKNFYTNVIAGGNLKALSTRTLLSAVDKVVDVVAKGQVKQIDLTTNDVLNDIGKRLIVPTNNPVDLTNNNLSVPELKKRLQSAVGTKLGESLGSQLNTDILNEYENTVNFVESSIDEFERIKNVLVGASDQTFNDIIPDLIEIFSDETLSGISINTTIPGLRNIFEREGAINGTTIFQEKFENNAVRESLDRAKDFDNNNDDNKIKRNTAEEGFTDVNAEYPRSSSNKENNPGTDDGVNPNGDAGSEVNKLARNDVIDTAIYKRQKDIRTGAPLPNLKSFDQPPIGYNAKYPFNKVLETESGHVVELDDSKYAERIHVYHRSGTFVEMDSVGNYNSVVKGSSYRYVDHNEHLRVEGQGRISIGRGVQVFVEGDADIEVRGSVDLSGEDINISSRGRLNLSATEEINMTSANINLEAKGIMDVKNSLGDIKVLSARDMYFTANNQLGIGAIANTINMSSVFDNVNITSGKGFGKATGEINLNNDTEFVPSTKNPDSSKVGFIGPRTVSVNNEIEPLNDPIPNDYSQRHNFDSEDSSNPADAEKDLEQMILKGIITQSDLDRQAISKQTKSVSSINNTVVRPKGSISDVSFLQDNFALSENFTLASLTSKAAFPPRTPGHTVIDQRGLSYGEIIENLQYVAINILEPAFDLNKDLIVTSGFRASLNSSNPNSQHCVGQAVDIQFRSKTKDQYFDIANTLARELNYDQFILEYQTAKPNGNPWIHISFKKSGNRKQVLTYNNHKLVSRNLNNLA